MDDNLIVAGDLNFCSPVKSDDKNWFSTASVMYESGAMNDKGVFVWGLNWQLGDSFLIPIVRLTDEQVQKGFTKGEHCDASMVEKYIGTEMPSNLNFFIADGKAGAKFVESWELINVDEWADYADQKICIYGEIQHNPQTNDATLANSLVIRIKTKSFSDSNTKYLIKAGLLNHLEQRSYIVLSN
jgi:hypothetical protein